MVLCFATNNRHKIEEVTSIAGGPGKIAISTLEEIGCFEELEENQDTIHGNAEQKARYVWERYQVSCFADDTGLEVVALNGAPGIYSARYAGPQRNSEDNIRLLLKNLEDATERTASFRTVISLFLPDCSRSFEGVMTGSILRQSRGTGGFGYDPIFQPAGFSKTLAEMSLEEKNQVSHRALAVKQMLHFLTTH